MWGSSVFDGTGSALTTIDIDNSVRGFINGFAACNVNSRSIELVIGVTNYAGTTNTNAFLPAHATAWGQMITDLNNYVASSKYVGITVAAGVDMELAWSSSTTGYNWEYAYNHATPYSLFDFGDAAGCPLNVNFQGTCSPGGGYQWSVNYVIAMADNSHAYALPELYTNNNAQTTQWADLSADATYFSGYSQMVFEAPLTQQGACAQVRSCGNSTSNSPQNAFNVLSQDLSKNPRSANSPVLYSTDIMYQ